MTCGPVPHGSILFNLYMLPLGQIIHGDNVGYHSYVDDTQINLALIEWPKGP